MAKLPLILSIVALICATGLGLAAKGKANEKIRQLAATQTELKKSDATVAARTTELGQANESLAAAGKEVEAKTAEVAKLDGEVKAGKDELAKSGVTLKQRDDKVADLEIEIKEAGLKSEAEAAAKAKVEAQLAEIQKQLDESKVALEQYRKKTVVADNTEAPRKTSGPVAPSPNLTGSVLAVNEGLNFLVLSVGDRQGVSVNTSMLVVRGGQRVATLKVTSIEPRTSIAEVVPGTMARGHAVQTGDQVVLVRGGERKSTGAAPAKAGHSGPAVEPALPEA